MRRASSEELLGAAGLVLAGVGVRIAFTSAFPSEPLSDFRGLVLFGVRLKEEGLAVPGWHWVQFNPGLPLIFSVLFRLFPHGVTAVARTATAAASGLAALLPYVIWRGVIAWRWRLLAGLLLALWPGQVLFSGIPAQENWAILPVVAVSALAVSRLRDPADEGHPVASGLLYAAAVAIRQESLVFMVPPALAAAGLPARGPSGTGRLWRFAAAAAIPLALLAFERRAATGRFAVTTEHGGLGVLGTLVPGRAAGGWADPTVYVASVEPGLLKDPGALRRAAWRLSLHEAARRWRYHLFRAGVTAWRLAVRSDADDVFWALEAPGAVASERRSAAASLARIARPLLRIELALVSGLFAASTALALARRDLGVLVLAAAVLLKLLVQVVFSPLGRLMVPAIAIELLVLVLAAQSLAARGTRRERLFFTAVGLGLAAVLLLGDGPLEGLAARKDEAPPRLTRFPLAIAGGGGWVECVVGEGFVAAISDRVLIAPAGPAGSPASRVACRLPELSEAGLELDVADEGGPLPRIEVDGAARKAAAPLPVPGWRRVRLSEPFDRSPREVVVDGAGRSLEFGFVRRDVRARPLPRDRALP